MLSDNVGELLLLFCDMTTRSRGTASWCNRISPLKFLTLETVVGDVAWNDVTDFYGAEPLEAFGLQLLF